MPIDALLSGLLTGFVILTVTTLSSLALLGVAVVFYVAVPTARAWLEGIFYSDVEITHIEQMERVDRMVDRGLKEFNRRNRPVIHLEY